MYFGNADYQALQVFKTLGDKDEEEDDDLSNELQDTSTFGSMMTEVRREILGEWRRLKTADLTKLTDFLEDRVRCTQKVLKTQINHIEVRHICRVVRKCLYEMFDDEKAKSAEMSLGGIMVCIEKKMKFVHDKGIDKSQKLHGSVGKYF